MLIRQVGVAEDHLQVGVPQDLLQVLEGAPPHHEVAGEGMPEIVEAEVLDADPLQGRLEPALDVLRAEAGLG